MRPPTAAFRLVPISTLPVTRNAPSVAKIGPVSGWSIDPRQGCGDSWPATAKRCVGDNSGGRPMSGGVPGAILRVRLDLDHPRRHQERAAFIGKVPADHRCDMQVSVYRCREAYLLVPTCFLPSMEAIARHGPARFRGTMRISGVVVETLVASIDASDYVTLALDHPLTASPDFPGGLVPVDGAMAMMERRTPLAVGIRPALGRLSMPEPVDRRTEWRGDVARRWC